MNIHYSRLPAIIASFEAAMRDEKLWAAVDNKVQMPEVTDLHFFDTKQAAVDFQDFNRSMQREIVLFPVLVTWDAMHEKVNAQIKSGIEYPNVTIDHQEMQELNQQYLMRMAAGELSQAMDGINWDNTFYDPLYANTEAESFEDKVDFNRLQCLIEDLSAFAQSNERAYAMVKEMLHHYWTGQPMEIQIESVLNGHLPRNTFLLLSPTNNQTMNMENLQFLKDNVKYTGFGEALFAELEKNIQEKKPEFQLHFTTQINNRPFDAVLDFRKSNTSDMYFFNRYAASIEKSNGTKVEQSFAINKGKGVTAKEAYNLLQGRAIKKELTNSKGETYQAWMQLDFDNKDDKGNHLVKKYNDNYGYDLRESVAKFPVLDLDGGEKEKDLMRSLEKGNAQAATIDNNGVAMKVFLEANPQYKTLNVYDEHFKMLKHDSLPKIQEQVSAPAEKVSDKNVNTKQDLKNAKGQTAGKGQLEKKRTRQGKGVKM